MQQAHKQPTLEDAINIFAQWRAERPKMQRIPKDLWAVVHSLSDRYQLSTVLNKLGLSHAQYRANCPSQDKESEASFIGFDIEANTRTQQVLSVKPVNSCCDIELKKPNGTTLIIHNASEQVMASLIQSFVG